MLIQPVTLRESWPDGVLRTSGASEEHQCLTLRRLRPSIVCGHIDGVLAVWHATRRPLPLR